MRCLTLLCSLLAAAPLRAQTEDPAVAQLREITNRETLTEEAAAVRARDIAAWLDAAKDRELRELAVLRTLAEAMGADEAAKQRASRGLVAWFVAHQALPVTGFDTVAGRIVMFDVVHRANAGAWSECTELLPVVLRVYPDHASVFWLLGRRGRDAGTAEGTQFLQQHVIPALLADHALDDAQRVHLLRLLYKVEYTGPKPFADVAGTDLAGRAVRTADHRGKVLLVDYWATWCRPCLEALPDVVAAFRRCHEQGLEVVSISIDDERDRERLAAKVRELDLPFPVLFDGKGWKSELAVANKVQAVPAMFLIDRKGRVRFTDLGGDALHARIAELLAEK
ncbi:MAG TPA: TlpA disulfide reductase family protein [Planctomycetota bacterium]|nr:TlpA disulfide reductase family protein [Planctomycetota bacterium]